MTLTPKTLELLGETSTRLEKVSKRIMNNVDIAPEVQAMYIEDIMFSVGILNGIILANETEVSKSVVSTD